MANRELMPWSREGGMWSGQSSPIATLRREMDRMLTDVLGGSLPTFGMGGNRMAAMWPSLDMEDNGREVRITAELPGMKRDDINLRIEDGVLTLSGERKDQREDKEHGYSERFFGEFERQVTLPRGVKEEACDAQFNNGVLTIVLPKSEEAASGKRIEIKEAAQR